MLVSFNWLKQYVNLPDSISAQELGLKLTMSTVEVDGLIKMSESLAGVVVGKINKIVKHPNADKLQVCMIDDGQTEKQIVCGGSNLVEGMKIALAPIGVKVRWHGQGELVEIKKVKIRGVESDGMICQSTEIGLGEMFPINDEAEIMNLNHLDCKLGTPLSQALGLDDTVFEIDNKSMTHRPDLWGHYGMAREVATLYNKQLVKYNPPEIKGDKTIKITVKVDDTKLCPRYMAVAIAGVEIKESPDWLQQRLIAIGLRPINNIVDITNYIMFDLGQPMHAFDQSKIKSPKSKVVNLQVRRAENGEMFKTLDGKEHKLSESDLVIADDEKAIALAGVMGGENSEISDNTKTIIFESANFEAVGVRRTALRLDTRTDSSARFEKSLDPNNCELALKRAVQMTLELCPNANVISNVVDEKKYNLPIGPITLNWQWLWRKIGMELDEKEVIKILESLGFEIKNKKEELLVTIPTWRATKDISIAEDLVEEISRIYGYDNIKRELPVFPIIPPEPNKLRQLQYQLLDLLVGNLNYNETYNYSFVSAQQINNFGGSLDNYIQLDNPISKEKPFLRREILLNLLENLEKNLAFFEDVKLVEIGKVFMTELPGERADKNGDDLLPRQDTMLSAVYSSKKDSAPYWQMRKIMELISSNFNLDLIPSNKRSAEERGGVCSSDLHLIPFAEAKIHQHPTRGGLIMVGETEVGCLYELNPMIGNNFGIKNRVGVLELNLNNLLETVGSVIQYQSISPYPSIVRDLAFIVKDNITHQDILSTLKDINPLLNEVKLFDVYQDKNIGEGYKSMAYHLTYGSAERTLTAEEIDSVQSKVVELLEEKLNVKVRK